jgi:hypothetical protein
VSTGPKAVRIITVSVRMASTVSADPGRNALPRDRINLKTPPLLRNQQNKFYSMVSEKQQLRQTVTLLSAGVSLSG